VTEGEGGDHERDPERRPAGTPGETAPSQVRTVAVHAEDVVAALETNHRGDDRAVLRVTPPFSGRMRARIHLDQGVDDDTVRVPPERLVDEVPSPPTPDDTADALRADPDAEFTRERHRDRHEAALAEWRATVRDRITDRVRLLEDHVVEVVVIGEG